MSTPRRCPKCTVTKDAETQYHKANRRGDGLSLWCKSCVAAYAVLRNEKRVRANAKAREEKWAAFVNPLITVPHKICTKCKVDQPMESFPSTWRTRDGTASWCKACHLQYVQKLNKTPSRKKARRKAVAKYRRRNPVKKMLLDARSRAQIRGIAFDLEPADIVIPEFCPVLGVRLVVHEGKLGPDSPSLDRVDTKQGYVKGNVAVISHEANRLKNSASLAQLEALVAYVRKYMLRSDQ